MRILMGDFFNMRLYNIYFLCKENVDDMCNLFFTTKDANGRAFFIEDWDSYKKALFSLRRIPLFQELVDDIYSKVPVFVREKSRPEIDSETKNGLNSRNNSIVNQMDTIIRLYESMGLTDNQSGIDVKIPECDSLTEYIKYLKDIDFVFTQCPFLQCENEVIKFNSVDVGSNWIKFIIAMSAATALTCSSLNNMAAVLDKALILKSQYVTIKQQEEMLKSMRTKNELAESEKEMFENLKTCYMKKAISDLEEEISELGDGEERGKAEKSLEKLVILLDKGVEIYASLDAPKEVQVLFPELQETQKLPGDLLKLLEDQKSQEE